LSEPFSIRIGEIAAMNSKASACP